MIKHKIWVLRSHVNLSVTLNLVCLNLYAHKCSLTGGEATSKEHVEEVLRSNVSLKAPVEVKASSV